MPTLYRKYRPQKFADFFGQEHLVKTITNEIAAGKIAHAYLFSGPRGTGKTTLARLFAKAINCPERKEGKFEPCDQCASCQEISNSRHLDVIEMDAASHTGVDNVRENIIDNAQFRPSKSPYKIFIIDEAHMLSTPAFNALLKTLEEPPAHVIFILATTEAGDIPATIVSRCQRFNFKKIPAEMVLEKLNMIIKEEGVKVDEEVLKRVAAKSDGCLRDAESLLGQLLTLDLKKISLEDIETYLPSANLEPVLGWLENTALGQTGEALKIIGRLFEEGGNLEQYAADLIDLLRALMIYKIQKEWRLDDLSGENKERLKKLAGQISDEQIVRLLEAAMKRRQEIRQAPVPQLPLELLTVEAAGLFGEKNDKPNRPEPPPAAPMEEAKPKEKKKLAEPESAKKIEDQPAEEPISKLSLDDIRTRWDEVIEKISASLPSLTFVLRTSHLKNLSGRRLTLALPYSLHRDKIEEKKNKSAIENCLRELFGENLYLCSEVASADAELAAVAAQFGGELI